MGCGTSTLLSENADIHAKVRPIIKRRIDELKRRRDLHKGSTPSKKELLAGDDCEKMSSANNDSLGSKSSPSEDSVEHGAAKVVQLVEEEEEEEEEEVRTIVECSREEENHEKEKTGDAEETEHEQRRGHEAELEEHDEDEGRCISPGSPSFRFYCVEAIPHDTDDEHESHIDSPKKNIETESTEERQASSESSAEADVQQRDSERRNPKRKLNRKFRSVIHKGGHVKSLLKVKSCYTPACSGSHDKMHLLQEAAA